MRTEFMRFEDVEALAKDGRGLLCRVAGREVWVPSDRIAIDDRVVQRPGDRGRLVVTRTVAIDLGLIVRR
jgi:hypothetical protein